MTNNEMSIYPVPNINETPAYEDHNVKIWAVLPSKILLNVKADDTFIGMDHDGWCGLLEAVEGFEIPKKAKRYSNRFDLNHKINISVGRYTTLEKKGKLAIQLYYGHCAMFTEDEWRRFKASVLEANLTIAELYRLLLKEDDDINEKHQLGLLKSDVLAEFSFDLVEDEDEVNIEAMTENMLR